MALLTYDDSVKRLIFGKKLQNHDVITGLLRFAPSSSCFPYSVDANSDGETVDLMGEEEESCSEEMFQDSAGAGEEKGSEQVEEALVVKRK